MKEIAVVLLNWNGIELLKTFLPSVVKHSIEAQIYLADNGSTDYSLAWVKENYSDIKIIENRYNHGFAGGYNVALANIAEPYYALLNTDVEVTENWLIPILETFKNNTKVAVIQPKIKDYKNKEYFEYAGAAGGYIDNFGYPFCRGRVFNSLEKDKGQYNQETEIFWASGACFFIRKEVYRNLGGFDEDFFAHQEEIDLCWRIQNQGHKILFCPNSTVYHLGGGTLSASSTKKTFLNFRNSLSMLLKNAPKKQLFKIIFIRLILDGLAVIRFVFKGKPLHTIAIIKAHFVFYTSYTKMKNKRQGNEKVNYFKIKNIPYFYFIKKKTKYSDLF